MLNNLIIKKINQVVYDVFLLKFKLGMYLNQFSDSNNLREYYKYFKKYPR